MLASMPWITEDIPGEPDTKSFTISLVSRAKHLEDIDNTSTEDAQGCIKMQKSPAEFFNFFRGMFDDCSYKWPVSAPWMDYCRLLVHNIESQREKKGGWDKSKDEWVEFSHQIPEYDPSQWRCWNGDRYLLSAVCNKTYFNSFEILKRTLATTNSRCCSGMWRHLLRIR